MTLVLVAELPLLDVSVVLGKISFPIKQITKYINSIHSVKVIIFCRGYYFYCNLIDGKFFTVFVINLLLQGNSNFTIYKKFSWMEQSGKQYK